MAGVNSAVEDMTTSALARQRGGHLVVLPEEVPPPGLLHMREAAWDHRLALAGWRSGKLNVADLMP